jgi:hypothetical protein
MALPATCHVTQRDTVRLISTGRLKDPVLLPLAANHGALEDIAALESVTNGRLLAQETGLPNLDPRELVFGRAGYTFINAAFTHTHGRAATGSTTTVAGRGTARSNPRLRSARCRTISPANSRQSDVSRTSLTMPS